MNIELNIPKQEKPRTDSFPTTTRKVRKWLTDLPAADLGDSARQFFYGLEQLNHLHNSAKGRLDIMESLRPTARDILGGLEKHFLTVGLPLPQRSRQIFDFNQAILQGMADGYKIVVAEVVSSAARLRQKMAALAVARAMGYLSEMLLRAAQIYSPVPRAVWGDLHGLYAAAEHADLLTYKFDDAATGDLAQQSVVGIYKQVLLFSLARPESLRRRDAEKLLGALARWVEHVHMVSAAETLPGQSLFAVDIAGTAPPSTPAHVDRAPEREVRLIEVTDLLAQVKAELRVTVDAESREALDDSLMPDTLRRLHATWSMSQARGSKRASKVFDTVVSVGLEDIYSNIVAEFEPVEEPPPESDYQAFLTLPKVERRDIAENDGYITHPAHQEMSNGPGIWDLIGNGNPLTATYREELLRRQEETRRLIEPSSAHYWKLVNISAGGYGLRWEGESPSKAHVGEVVGLRDVERGSYAQWRIGVIRWLQFVNENCFEAGIQALSPHGMAVLVQPDRNRPQQPCLILPEIKPIGQTTSMIAPAHMYRTGQVLRVSIFDRDLFVKLLEIVEHTGFFTQFQITSTADPSTLTGIKGRTGKEFA